MVCSRHSLQLSFLFWQPAFFWYNAWCTTFSVSLGNGVVETLRWRSQMGLLETIRRVITGDFDHPTDNDDIAFEFHVDQVVRVSRNMPVLCGELKQGTVACGTEFSMDVCGNSICFTVVDIAMFPTCVRSITAHGPTHGVPLGLVVRPFNVDVESLQLPFDIKLSIPTE